MERGEGARVGLCYVWSGGMGSSMVLNKRRNADGGTLRAERNQASARCLGSFSARRRRPSLAVDTAVLKRMRTAGSRVVCCDQGQQDDSYAGSNNKFSPVTLEAERGVGDIAPAYAALAAIQIMPFVSNQYLAYVAYFLVTASCSLVIGAKQNMLEPVVEKLSTKSAVLAPVAGSVFLFGMYLLIKYTALDISIAYNVLATSFGLLCLQQALIPILESLLPPASTTQATENEDGLAISREELIAGALTVTVGGLYAFNVAPHFAFSNAIALGIATSALRLVKPGSFTVAASLLSGLFLYDCFWVFGSDVMVTVATQIDAPAKLLFPKAMSSAVASASAAAAAAAGNASPEMAAASAYPYAVLGLGDIVVPGIFAALMLTVDKELVQSIQPDVLVHVRSGPYFRGAVIAYTLGLTACFAVNSVTHAAQPALFYLVPAMLGASIAVAVSRNELDTLLRFSSGASSPYDDSGAPHEQADKEN